MGVIYGEYEGCRYPTFWTGVPYPHSSPQKGEEFAVNCCQQRRSVEIKLQSFFDRCQTIPTGGAHDAPQTPCRTIRGYLLPILLLPKAPHSPPELVPPLYRPKLRTCGAQKKIVTQESQDVRRQDSEWIVKEQFNRVGERKMREEWGGCFGQLDMTPGRGTVSASACGVLRHHSSSEACIIAAHHWWTSGQEFSGVQNSQRCLNRAKVLSIVIEYAS